MLRITSKIKENQQWFHWTLAIMMRVSPAQLVFSWMQQLYLQISRKVVRLYLRMILALSHKESSVNVELALILNIFRGFLLKNYLTTAETIGRVLLNRQCNLSHLWKQLKRIIITIITRNTTMFIITKSQKNNI